MKFILVHGALGGSRENWFPWLKKRLEILGNEVVAPDFPTPQGQTFDLWMHELNKVAKNISPDTIFVGHSIGCAFILAVLEKLKVKIKACIFVAGFTGPLGSDLDKINKPFAEKNFNWEKIKKNCEKFVLISSDDDPYVPVARAEILKTTLGAELTIVNGAGHFNWKTGYNDFPLLLEKIIELVK